MEAAGRGSNVTALLAWAALLSQGADVRGAPGMSRAAEVDVYGGDRAIRGEKTGRFHLEQKRGQWLFITPEGHGLLPRSVAAIYFSHPGLTPQGKTYQQIVEAKYRKNGDGSTTAAHERWANNVRTRLRRWGFNSIGPYSYPPVTADRGQGGRYYRTTNGMPPDPMPSVATQANMEHALRQGGVKNLWGSLWATGAGVGRAFFGDVFDPKFAAFVETEAQDDARRLKDEPERLRWTLFAFVEQTDWMRGVESRHPHLGWAAAAANFAMTEGIVDFAGRKARFADTKVYTKYAIRDYLKGRYGGIEKLNRAWGTSYTGWDSHSGWGKGTGFLDEDGSGLGKPLDPGKPDRPALRQDLDAFAEKLMRRFYRTVHAARKKACPAVLLATNNMDTPREYVVRGLVSEDGRQTYSDIICISDRQRAVRWYGVLRRPFFVISIFAQAVNDSPLGYRGTVAKVEYDEVLSDGRKALTSDPNQNGYDRKVVNDWKSRVIVTASGVNFWWAGHAQLKIPYRTYTQFAPAVECRTYAGKYENVRFASRPWKSLDWLAPSKFAVHQENPGAYFALKRSLKPGDAFWRYEPWNNRDTQEQRARLYGEQVLKLINTRTAESEYIYCGFNYWAWWDTSWTGITWDTAYNFGLVTFHDNAYDGREAVWARATDEDGYPIGGEYRPPHVSEKRGGFGDFVSGVTRANQEIRKTITKRCGVR